MKSGITTALLVIFLAYTQTVCPADGQEYIFTQLSSDTFIPKAKCIYKENSGYLWIGTSKGLYRFDGFEYKHYFASTHEGPLSGSAVLNIYQDSHHLLWIMTDKGVGIYDREKDMFDPVPLLNANNSSVYSCCETENGLYFGGVNTIFTYNRHHHRLEPFYSFAFTSPFHVRFMGQLSEDELVISNNRSVSSIRLSARTVKQDFITLASTMSAIFTDSSATTWVAYYNKGLNAYDSHGRQILSLNHNNSNLSLEAILCMEQQDSLLWVGTDGGGINVVNTLNNKVTVLSHSYQNPCSFPTNAVRTLYADKNGTIWAGSLRDGIINIRSGHIRTYTAVPDNSPYGLTSHTVLSLHPDSQNNLWIGTDGRGVNKYDITDRRFTHYPSTDGFKVASIAEYSSSQLLLSFYLQGFYLFNKENGAIKKFRVNDKHINSRMYYTATTVNLLDEDQNHILFISDKMQRYNKADNTFQTISADSKDIANGYFLPAGRWNDCLYFYDEHQVYRLAQGDSVMHSIYHTNDVISCLNISDKGKMWLASNGNILKVSLPDGDLTAINKGLYKGDISTIIEGQNGLVWLGVENKVYAYLTRENSFVRIGKSQGVENNVLQRSSNLATTDGTIYLGGNNGLIVIEKDFKISSRKQPQVILTDLTVDGKSVMKGENSAEKGIRLHWDDKFLEASVMTLEDDLLRPKKFRFEVTGSNTMVFETEQPSLRLNSLLPGDYAIHVSCDTQNGLWTQPEKLISFHVMPPYYTTWWFITICLLALLLIVLSLFYAILIRKDNDMKLALKEQEKKLYEEKVRFLINMNHELRTPLTLICGPLKRILSKMKHNDDSFGKLNKIYHQSERMKKLLDMVLDLRKLESGNSIMHLEEYPVNQWVTNIVNEFAEEAQDQGISIGVSLDKNITLLHFDEEKLHIVLTNLIVNAMKHSAAGNEILIKTEFTADGTAIRFSVIDSGTGLDQAETDKLFTRFYQGNNEKYGTGIGLSYSKTLVELHHGDISAQNNENQPGACFSFTIPVSIPDTPVQEGQNDYLNKHFTLTSETDTLEETRTLEETCDTLNSVVLLVDDSTELLQFMVESLQSRFEKVLTATNGKEALAIMSKTIPDVIVSDVMMPKMNGYELCSCIKKNPDLCHIPIILLTARNGEISRKYGYRIGAEAYLSKPFEIDTLYELIVRNIKSKEIIKRYYMQLSNTPDAEDMKGMDEVFIHKLNEVINNNISNQELDINFICKELAISRSTFYNRLKLITDISGNEYISNLRLQYAIHLMKTTNLNFTEIAERSGFTTSRYFSTTFKKFTGMTPTQYKRSDHRPESNTTTIRLQDRTQQNDNHQQ